MIILNYYNNLLYAIIPKNYRPIEYVAYTGRLIQSV